MPTRPPAAPDTAVPAPPAVLALAAAPASAAVAGRPRLAPHAALIGTVPFVIVVVATPARAWPVLAGAGSLVGLAAIAARIPARRILGRLWVALPFVLFAALLPFVASGPHIEWGPLTLSEAGLVGGALLLARVVIAVLAAVVLTEVATPLGIVEGLEQLRFPRQLTGILTFMVRFGAVVVEASRRSATARLARGDRRGAPGRLAATAAGAGTLFVRSYERGERVERAMLARGFTGELPRAGRHRATAAEWAIALAPAAVLGLALAGTAALA